MIFAKQTSENEYILVGTNGIPVMQDGSPTYHPRFIAGQASNSGYSVWEESVVNDAERPSPMGRLVGKIIPDENRTGRRYVGVRLGEEPSVTVNGHPLTSINIQDSDIAKLYEWGRPYGNRRKVRNLSMSILTDYLGELPPNELVQIFQNAFIESLGYGDWEITESEIDEWFDALYDEFEDDEN